MTENSKKLLAALVKGEVRVIGGIVFDPAMKPLMNTTDLCETVRSLSKVGISVCRQDAGGSPRWALEL